MKKWEGRNAAYPYFGWLVQVLVYISGKKKENKQKKKTNWNLVTYFNVF